MATSNFDKYPKVSIAQHNCFAGWEQVAAEIQRALQQVHAPKKVVAIECNHGVFVQEIMQHLVKALAPVVIVNASGGMKPEADIAAMVQPFVTDDPVFGYITPLQLEDYFDTVRVEKMQQHIADVKKGIVIVAGTGATLISPEYDILIYADMPRWEIQLRFRKNLISNLGRNNKEATFAYQYKHSYFVDWRVCDRQKKKLHNQWDYVLDTTIPEQPRMITATAYTDAMQIAVHRPFRVVPFFDPGPWGGQWLKEVCDLDRNEQNFAWGFDCVPEENSILFSFGDTAMELPAVNLVYFQPEALLGKPVYAFFGDEFPIRFDFLDTMQGGNLSLQVHPLKEYIREKFGMAYTQDESYYFMEAAEEAYVYLGLKDNIVPDKMISELEAAQQEGSFFDAEKYVQKWQVKKHDHVSIPAGTVHCSGANTVVLEISATPYIFTFKLWDWGRMGLDGKPRPISLEHGKQVIQWNRTTQWTQENILNQVEPLCAGDGWREERTGLDEASFIETRRHWFTKPVTHNTNGVVNVLNLIEGRCAIVESPSNAFAPFVVHYAETFIVPAATGEYTIRPYGESEGTQCATMKASVRTEKLAGLNIN